MQYVVLYLAFGLPLVVFYTLMETTGERPRYMRVLFCLMLWAFWPLAVIAVMRERLTVTHIITTCAWCGEIVTPWNAPDKMDLWKAHHNVCPKHPLRSEIERLQGELSASLAENARMQEQLDLLTITANLEQMRSLLDAASRPADEGKK